MLKLSTEEDIVDRVVRAERLALDMARVVAAADVWRARLQAKGWPAKPIVRKLAQAVEALNAAHPEWRRMVEEMGRDVDENPLAGEEG